MRLIQRETDRLKGREINGGVLSPRQNGTAAICVCELVSEVFLNLVLHAWLSPGFLFLKSITWKESRLNRIGFCS